FWERTYDELGRPKMDSLPNGITTSYQFDEASQLISINHSTSDNKTLSGFNYQYSDSGSITSKVEALGGYQGNPGQLSVGYAYDALDRLIFASNEGSFTLDGLGNRVGANFVHNELNQLLQDNQYNYTY